MSKEFDLTRQAQNPYSKGMPESSGEGAPRPQNVRSPQSAGETPPSPEQSAVREAWASHYRDQGLDINRLGADERGVIEMAIAAGTIPENHFGNALGEVLEHYRSVNQSASEGETPREETPVTSVEGGERPPRRPRRTAGGTDDGERRIPRASAGVGGGGRRPPRRPTATGGAGGGEPPEEPPTGGTTSGAEGQQPGEHPHEAFRPHFDLEGIEDEAVKNILEAAVDKYRFAQNDEERHKVFAEAIDRIDLLSEDEAKAVSKNMARNTIREQAEQFHLSRLEGVEIRRETLHGEAEDVKKRLVNAVTAEGSLSNPDVYVRKLNAVKEILDDLDPNDRTSTAILAAAIHEVEDIREYDALIEDTLEYSLERFLNRADADITADYPKFTFTESENMSVIAHAGRRFDEARQKARIELGQIPGKRDMFKYLTGLTNRRSVMHELYRSMNDAESFLGLVTRGLRKEGMDFIEKQLVGVSDVQVIYDKVLLSMLSLKGKGQGWLLEEDFKDGDDMVLSILRESAASHSDVFNKTYIDANNNLQTRPLAEWEITRAFHMGRDLSGACERRVVYAILGGVPLNADNSLKSVMHEPIARRLAPLKLIPDRFFGHPLAKRFLSILKTEQKRDKDTDKIDDYKYGYVRNGKPIGFFGLDQGDSSILDLTITDPKTNSWRAHLLFLKNPKYSFEDPESTPEERSMTTIGEYLDRSKERIIADGLERRGIKPLASDASTKERKAYKKAVGDILRNEWNASGGELQKIISKQRLFLGTLVRYPDLSSETKAIIWKNIAKLNPSSIASLFPNETLRLLGMKEKGVDENVTAATEAQTRKAAIKQWEEIRLKLWTAERMRLYNDAKFLSTGEGALSEVNDYFGAVGLNASERFMIAKLQALNLDDVKGDRQAFISETDKWANILANANFPFTAFLDDAPETDWNQSKEFDITRLLVSDHNSYGDGFSLVMNPIDNPVMKAEDAAKNTIDAFNKVKGPPGLDGAQRVFEPIVRTNAKIRTMNRFTKWIGETFTKMMRHPASPIQEYNLQAEVADDESQTAAYLTAVAQAAVLSDDPGELDKRGRTQMIRLRDQTDSDKKHVLGGVLRMMMQLLGPTFALSFAQSLGIKV